MRGFLTAYKHFKSHVTSKPMLVLLFMRHYISLFPDKMHEKMNPLNKFFS